MTNWKKVYLGDVASIVDSLHKTPTYSEVGFPMVRVTDINGGHLNLTNTHRVSREVYEEFSKKYKPKKGDIVMSRVGTYGVSSLVTDDVNFCLGQNTLFIVPKVNPYFLYYSLNSKDAKNQIEELATGSTQKTISLKSIKEIEVNLPDLPTQTRIASILSALDDKIELNCQMNHTLEQMAQVLFKKYFVDDVDPENLPKGWRYAEYGEFIESVSITHKFPNSQIVFLNTGDIYNGNVLHRNYSDVNSLPGQAKKSIQINDILFTEIRPANKRFAFINFSAEDFVVSTKLMVLRAKASIDSLFFYFLLTREETLTNLQNIAEARSGTFPQITFDQVRGLKFVLPNNGLIEKFDKEFLRPNYEMIFNNEKEIANLIEIRNSLLPKLMNAEIEINQQESVVA